MKSQHLSNLTKAQAMHWCISLDLDRLNGSNGSLLRSCHNTFPPSDILLAFTIYKGLPVLSYVRWIPIRMVHGYDYLVCSTTGFHELLV